MSTLLSPLFSLLLLVAQIPGGWLGVYLAADRDEAVITEVIPASPAQKAGLQAGDQILAVGDTATPTREKLVEVIGKTAPGTKVALKVKRKDAMQIIAVVIGERPEETAVTESAPPKPAAGGRPSAPAGEAQPEQGVYLGISLQESAAGLTIDRVLPDSPAAAAGVKGGEKLEAIGSRKVRTTQDLDRALAGAKPGQPLELRLGMDGTVRSVLVEPRARETAVAGERPRVAQPVAPRRVVEAEDAPKPEAKPAPAAGARDLDAEIAELRAELKRIKEEVAELKKQLRRE